MPLHAPSFVHDSHYADAIEQFGGIARWPERADSAHHHHPAAADGAERKLLEDGVAPLPVLGDVSDAQLPPRGAHGEAIKPLRCLDDVVVALTEGRDDAYAEREAAIRALPGFLEERVRLDVMASDALRGAEGEKSMLALRDRAPTAVATITLNDVVSLRHDLEIRRWGDNGGDGGRRFATVPAATDGADRHRRLLDTIVSLLTGLTGVDVDAQRLALARSVCAVTVLEPSVALGWLALNLYSHRYSIGQRAFMLEGIVAGCECLADGGRLGPAAEVSKGTGAPAPASHLKNGPPPHEHFKPRVFPPIPSASATSNSLIGSGALAIRPADIPSGGAGGGVVGRGTVRWRSVALDRQAASAVTSSTSTANLLVPFLKAAVHSVLAQHDTGHYAVMADELHMAAAVVGALHRLLVAVRLHASAVAGVADPLVSFGVVALSHPHPSVRLRAARLLKAVFALWEPSGSTVRTTTLSAAAASVEWRAAAELTLAVTDRVASLESNPDVHRELRDIQNGLAALV